MPEIDIVIPTFNRHGPLNRCLDALRAQEYRDFGVIVVDDGSAPGIEQTIPATLRKDLNLRIVSSANGGPARARNLGVAESDAEFVAFIDDDVLAAPEMLRLHREAVGDSPTKVSFGPLVAPAGWQPTPWNLWEADKLSIEYDKMTAGVYEPTWRQFFTGNAFVRRRHILAAGGFDERFTRAEDVELGLRLAGLGCDFAFVPGAIGWHHAERSLKSWLAIPRAYGRLDVAIDEIHPDEERAVNVEREMREMRTLPVRVARTVSSRRFGRPVVTNGSVGCARVLYAAGAKRLALRFLSLAFDAEYVTSFRAARRTGAGLGPRKPAGASGSAAGTAERQGINSPSTPST
ncbi:hypothetical protein AYO38_05335 [bacterium SCGC AG-212-C10]|nr:hypothetical protein AYO38_05335 [bacterium SCGC AG-212-C10]